MSDRAQKRVAIGVACPGSIPGYSRRFCCLAL
uniref:Uncharacterized protein n=1 Tax=virus sp. ctL1g6 TaxID=2827988 RepID=A0A8S5RFF1_9VIRU|nr:MAG TPA: hypothetical protein [virus sp. ctL1g6]